MTLNRCVLAIKSVKVILLVSEAEDGEDGALIESVDYVDKEFRNLVKEIANDETLLLSDRFEYWIFSIFKRKLNLKL